jgi:starvation-inducible DNA-binding protein
MKPHIGISDKNLDGVNKALTAVLADETILYIKTRKFHWNVDGESFMEFHKLFEAQYKQLEETIDEVAERISKLGGQTIGTTKEFQDNSKLKEAPGKYPTRKEMVKELLDDHETVIRELRKNIEDCSEKFKDAGTADFLTKVMEDHETIAWTLRRYSK